jgi:hypothetical protein
VEDARVPGEDDGHERSDLMSVERSPVLCDPGNVDRWHPGPLVARLALPKMEPHSWIVTSREAQALVLTHRLPVERRLVVIDRCPITA